MSRSVVELAVAAFLLCSCGIPYPVVTAGGPFEVPPSAEHGPLRAGARVQLVTTAPARCRPIGLATGVGGVADQFEDTADRRYAEFREQAVIALRNAVAAAGGTHVRIDAEVRYTAHTRLTHVIVRGSAFAC